MNLDYIETELTQNSIASWRTSHAAVSLSTWSSGRVGGRFGRGMEVICPDGVQPGDTVAISTEDGISYEVVVPDGLQPGQTFFVEIEMNGMNGMADHLDEAADLSTEAASRPVEDALDAELEARRRLSALVQGAEEPGSILHSLANYDELQCFIAENAAGFEGWTSDGEQRLEWTGMHLRYVELIETRIQQLLTEQGVSGRELYAMLAQYLPSATGSGGGLLLHKLISMSDFQLFCAMMRDAPRE